MTSTFELIGGPCDGEKVALDFAANTYKIVRRGVLTPQKTSDDVDVEVGTYKRLSGARAEMEWLGWTYAGAD